MKDKSIIFDSSIFFTLVELQEGHIFISFGISVISALFVVRREFILYTNLLEEQKEKTNEQNLQRPNETGTGTVRQGVSGDNQSVSELQSKGNDANTNRTNIQNERAGQEVGIESGTSDRLYRGSREWSRISDAKNGYNSKLRRTSNKGVGRGRDRILNLYRYGEFIRENINIATTPTNINGNTYSIVKDEALLEFILDMRKEFQKVSTAKGFCKRVWC